MKSILVAILIVCCGGLGFQVWRYVEDRRERDSAKEYARRQSAEAAAYSAWDSAVAKVRQSIPSYPVCDEVAVKSYERADVQNLLSGEQKISGMAYCLETGYASIKVPPKRKFYRWRVTAIAADAPGAWYVDNFEIDTIKDLPENSHVRVVYSTRPRP